MKNFLVICILFSSLSLYSQSVKIIKDSVCIDGKYYELQELTIHSPKFIVQYKRYIMSLTVILQTTKIV